MGTLSFQVNKPNFEDKMKKSRQVQKLWHLKISISSIQREILFIFFFSLFIILFYLFIYFFRFFFWIFFFIFYHLNFVFQGVITINIRVKVFSRCTGTNIYCVYKEILQRMRKLQLWSK